MKLLITLLLVVLICVVLFVFVTPSRAAVACPLLDNVNAAQLDITDGSGRHYLIDPFAQGFEAAKGNVAGLSFASKPDRWLVNGVKVDPDWQWAYHITYWDEHWQSVGEAWFATLKGYDGVYFYFVMPAESADHPYCGYGSIDRETVDVLLKPRR